MPSVTVYKNSRNINNDSNANTYDKKHNVKISFGRNMNTTYLLFKVFPSNSFLVSSVLFYKKRKTKSLFKHNFSHIWFRINKVFKSLDIRP